MLPYGPVVRTLMFILAICSHQGMEPTWMSISTWKDKGRVVLNGMPLICEEVRSCGIYQTDGAEAITLNIKIQTQRVKYSTIFSCTQNSGVDVHLHIYRWWRLKRDKRGKRSISHENWGVVFRKRKQTSRVEIWGTRMRTKYNDMNVCMYVYMYVKVKIKLIFKRKFLAEVAEKQWVYSSLYY